MRVVGRPQNPTTFVPAQRGRGAVSSTIKAKARDQQAQPSQRYGSSSGSGSCRGSGAAAQAQPTSRRRLLSYLPPCACAICAAAASTQPRARNTTLDRVFAEAMATGMAEYEGSIAPVKRQLFATLLSGLHGSSEQPAEVLELGVGTGPNMQYYADFYSQASGASAVAAAATASRSSNDSLSSGAGGQAEGSSAEAGGASARGSSDVGGGGSASSSSSGMPPVHITGLDCNRYMRPYLEESLQRSGWPQDCFTWVQGSAEGLPLADASMDAVVCTLVLCSVPDVQAVLDQVARVLKPGGSLLFIEHTLAPQGRPLLRLGQWALEPLQRVLADNCHLTRDPLPLIRATAGLDGGDAVPAMRFAVEGASLIAPHVAGIVTRGGGAASTGSQGTMA